MLDDKLDGSITHRYLLGYSSSSSPTTKVEEEQRWSKRSRSTCPVFEPSEVHARRAGQESCKDCHDITLEPRLQRYAAKDAEVSALAQIGPPVANTLSTPPPG